MEKKIIYYVYILLSFKDFQFYTGCSANLNKRLMEHQKGKVKSTKNRGPLELAYYEACRNREDAIHREKYLKTSWGKRYIKIRIKNYLKDLR